MSPRGSFTAVSGVHYNEMDRISSYTTQYLTTENRYPEFPGFPRTANGTLPFRILLWTPVRMSGTLSDALPDMRVGQRLHSRHHLSPNGYEVLRVPLMIDSWDLPVPENGQMASHSRNLSSALLRSDDCMVLSARQTIQSSDRPNGS